MAKPRMNGGMKVAVSKEFRLPQKSQIPLSRAAHRVIRAYREKKPEGFRFYSN
jgi:hypothetical protein